MEFQNYEENYKNIKKITKISKKMIDSLPDTVENIIINGEVLYAYLSLKPDIRDDIIDYNYFELFTNGILESSMNDPEFINSQAFQKTKEFILCWSEFWHTNELLFEECINLDLSRFTNLKELCLSFIFVTTVNNIPESLKQLKIISCETNKIDTLPHSLDFFNCNNNNIRELPQIQHTNLTHLFCSSNLLRNIPNLPKTLEILYCSQNYIKILPKLPSRLEYLSCNNNRLVWLSNTDELPSELYSLQCDNNNLTGIPKLPKTLKILNCGKNNITKMPDLPPFLTTLNCANNPLKEYPILPPSIVNYTL
jgi:hypothetical protein